jgi:hypothetical protein
MIKLMLMQCLNNSKKDQELNKRELKNNKTSIVSYLSLSI